MFQSPRCEAWSPDIGLLAGSRWRVSGAVVVTLLVLCSCAPRVAHEVPSLVASASQVDSLPRSYGDSSVRRVHGMLEARLSGTPSELGSSHTKLLRSEIRAVEGTLWAVMEKHLPNRFLRWFTLQFGRFRYRHLGESYPHHIKRELRARAAATKDDLFDGILPPLERYTFLEAAYDISLAYQSSVLIGCTTFVFPPNEHRRGVLMARAFDFEVDPIFDRMKAVFLVSQPTRHAFASVAWPGFVGVVSGMNEHGLSVVVHGGRAGEFRRSGEPVAHALRRSLEEAVSVEDALEVLAAREPMVSHIAIVADASGQAAVVERVPGRPDHVRMVTQPAVVTNHFSGPMATDEKNQEIRRTTSTMARYERGEELLSSVDGPVDVRQAVRFLRDRAGVGGQALPRGDRHAINGLIAAHGVVFETGPKKIWVSKAPHMLGEFVEFPVGVLLGSDDRQQPIQRSTIPEDPLLLSQDRTH